MITRTCFPSLALVLAVGCDAAGPVAELPLPDQLSCELAASSYDYQPKEIDWLVVVDTSPAIAAHRERWLTAIDRIGAEFDASGDENRPHLRIGVIS